MFGNYGRPTIYGHEDNLHTVLTIFHILFSKIICINYIIANLMTAYNMMKEKGDFAYKSNRYEYIERYQLALADGWGYSELVTTPAPMNIILIFIVPTIFNRPMFKKFSDMIGKIFFWMENLGYIMLLVVYSCFLIPIIFIKFIISMFKNLPVYKFVFYVIPWLFLGLFYLNFLLQVDLFNFFRILADYQDDDASQDEKKTQEKLQDK